MQKLVFTTTLALLIAALWAPRWIDFSSRSAGAVTPAAKSGSTQARAAKALLITLDAEKRAKATFAYGDAERINWHFIPRDRKGLALNEMNEAQRGATTALLQAGLSQVGYRTVEQVRGLEAVLREIEGPERRFPRDPELYFLSIFGEPSDAGSWGWRFEGHHLCLNFTLKDGELASATPIFFGANPAIVRSGPLKGLRVLAGVEDVARELMTSLDEGQLARSLGKGDPEEVAETQKATYDADLPAGLPVAELDARQRAIFLRLVQEYTKHHDDAARRAAEKRILNADPGRVHIAWRGSTKAYEGHSYIVHGPGFVISYSNFQNGAAHVHAALRLTEGEFGL